MSLPESLQALLDPDSYPHSCGTIELIETHISWVLLTGGRAYKLKKPVRFSFVDFSTLALREHFCREEVRCNRAFSPDLYEGVCAIVRLADGSLAVLSEGSPEPGEVIEWAVQMRQFDTRSQLDRMLARGELQQQMLRRFGAALAAKQRDLPVLAGAPEDVDERILGPMEDNFLEIAHTSLNEKHARLLEETQTLARASAETLRSLMARRLTRGHVRECHGDLHLANLAFIEGEVSAFDCLEFNANLRWIDTMSDVAFLFMDCHVRDRQDLAYGFLDGYLDESGDYEGARLLGYFCAYRSMVRAKVAALRHEQSLEDPTQADVQAQQCLVHIRWACDWLSRPPGRLVLMCGLSGSGKSHLAGMLVTELPALRLRSDVARKRQAGLAASSRSQSPMDAGLYATGRTEQVYAALADAALALVETGEHVIVDATFIESARRRKLLERASALGVQSCVLYCTAPVEILRERIAAREATGADPSEATLEVLDRQIERLQPPGGDEPAITVDMGPRLSVDRVRAIAERVLRLA